MRERKFFLFALVGAIGVALFLLLVPFSIHGRVEPNLKIRIKPIIAENKDTGPIKDKEGLANKRGNGDEAPEKAERVPIAIAKISSRGSLYERAIKALRWKSAHFNSSELATKKDNLLLRLPIWGLPAGLDFDLSSLLGALKLGKDERLRDNIFAWLVKFKKECSKVRDGYFRLAGLYVRAVVRGRRSGFLREPPRGYNGEVLYGSVSSMEFNGRVYFRREDAPGVFDALDKYRLCGYRAWIIVRGLIESSLERGRKKRRAK